MRGSGQHPCTAATPTWVHSSRSASSEGPLPGLPRRMLSIPTFNRGGSQGQIVHHKMFTLRNLSPARENTGWFPGTNTVLSHIPHVWLHCEEPQECST